MEENNKYSGVKEIARRANVSIATVDRVIHNRTGVSEKTRKKINAIIAELDYQPNIMASRLASRKTIRLSILIPSVSPETDFWEAPLRGVQRAQNEIRQYGVKVNFYFFDLNDKASFTKQAKRILEEKTDGILLAPSFVEESVQFSNQCKAQGIPFIYVDSSIPGQHNLSYIGPHLFKSGYLGGQLITFGLGVKPGKILIANISKDNDNQSISDGFEAYFKDHQLPNEIIRVNITDTDYPSVSNQLSEIRIHHPDLAAIFVTNSRVFTVATYLEKNVQEKILLLGYDFLKENVNHLKKGTIDFLICHKPEEQWYKGVMSLYQTLVLSTQIEKEYLMPIDIITKENYEFYPN
jgi:LacI family transcriptional regulator